MHRRISQQQFLAIAMQQLDMSPDQLCKRISVPRQVLDKWLAPTGSSQFRSMPGQARSYIRALLRHSVADSECALPSIATPGPFTEAADPQDSYFMVQISSNSWRLR